LNDAAAPSANVHVFIPFKRLHGRGVPGTGIGLGVCRRVIEAHGGRIWLDSTFGKGAAFSFTLPPASSRSFFALIYVPVSFQRQEVG
jgi:signal transduction histidine kinase